MLNEVRLCGGLVKDPEQRTTSGGTSVAVLVVETSDRRKLGGEWQDVPERHRVVVFGRFAEACGKHLSAGRQVLVCGKLTHRSYDKDGEKKWITEVLADQVHFLGGGRGRGNGGG